MSDEVGDIQGCGFTGVFVGEASERLRLGDGVGGVLTTTGSEDLMPVSVGRRYYL